MKQSQHLDFAIASFHFITLAMTKYVFTHLGCSLSRYISNFRLKGSTLRLKGSTLRLKGSTLRLKGSTLRLKGSTFRLKGSTLRLKGSTLRLKGSTLRIKGSTLRIKGSTLRIKGSKMPWLLEIAAIQTKPVCAGCKNFIRFQLMIVIHPWVK
jgi:hypothetical protein